MSSTNVIELISELIRRHRPPAGDFITCASDSVTLLPQYSEYSENLYDSQKIVHVQSPEPVACVCVCVHVACQTTLWKFTAHVIYAGKVSVCRVSEM